MAIILPGQEEIILTCTTNSPSLEVMWFSGISGTPLSGNNTYRVQVPPDSFEYNCSVIDPTTDTVAASGVIVVRSAQGK